MNHYTTSIDANGNKIVKVKPASGRGFSIQTNGNLPQTHRDGVGAWTEGEVREYVRKVGTASQRAALCTITARYAPTTEQAEANARLIAAAPDLLSALKNARGMLETASRYFPKSIKNGDRFSLLNVLANSVDPAIRKAEGGAA